MHLLRLRAAGFAAAAAVSLFAGGLAFVHAPQSAHALTSCDVADNSFDAQESAFLGLINAYRAQNGLAALTVSTNLNRSSSWLAVDMASKNYFDHTDSLGRAPSQRATDCGYPSGAGENIAAGTVWDTAQEAFDAWRNSAGHNANMLNSSYKQIGIARYNRSGSTYGWYWVTDFGLVNDGTNGGTGGGGTTTPPPAQTVKAAITSPTAGSTLPGNSATFNWDAGSGASEYFFYAGSTPGANNYYGNSTGLNRSVTVSSLPANGSSVYVRLWTRFGSGWQYTDYTYRAATTATATKAAISSPAPGTALSTGPVSFSWTSGAGASEYFFYVGTTQGANNIYGQSTGLRQSQTVILPSHGTLWVRLWTRSGNSWQYTDYSYR
jgi:uncharacterized protein YkwD